jgi:hypothetical protein
MTENTAGQSAPVDRPCYPSLVVAGLRRYITAAFDHHDDFLARFWPSEHIQELHECYMASERTKLVVMFTDGSFVTNCISTDEFISWAESVNDG